MYLINIYHKSVYAIHKGREGFIMQRGYLGKNVLYHFEDIV